ncbi:hypothetical protein O7626_34085 [Micromonospora sp. WMMD1102]|uniref:hypothetical protein n=1 Tax=Micromonospora sp. WMMD1102 TaxID=3016105 RepID=UPI0024156E46|nr:hypothetical protein [Micromonospora sp. WMMD1102]MDG4790883.1 hypothetical protein [Micromonospora sp. WMMD1102]
MTDPVPSRAAREPAEAGRPSGPGDPPVRPSRRWLAVWSLFFVLVWARWDVPAAAQRWYALLLLAVASALLVGAMRSDRNVPPRSPSTSSGWRPWVLFATVAILSCAAVVGGGLALRSLAVPFPFTSSSIVVVIGVLASTSWWRQRRQR